MQLLVRAGGLPSHGRGENRILKINYLLKTYIEPMISNVISEVDVLVYVVLSKAEHHLPYGK